jgi:hypothetical protein
MSEAVDRYLIELRRTLDSCDAAVLQDALADAEEYLSTELERLRREQPPLDEASAFRSIVERYGSPEEVAKAYRDIESRVVPTFSRRPGIRDRSLVEKFFAVAAEPRAYAALVYLLVSLVTGTVYFTWAVSGLMISAGTIILVFGILIFGMFVFSVQGFALIEGRIVEALLGERMPRRAARTPSPGKGLVGMFVTRIKDRRTWTTLLYMIVQLPLGVFYFTVSVTLLAYSLELIASPILLVLRLPLISVNGFHYVPQAWVLPILVIAGVLDLIVTLHLAKWVGRWHGKWAKALLVHG